ncbi:MAG: hypothetical protein J6M12_02040, partial [Clostridia bacterium]|nr:hypothetical protein [Clostridia bacterium]
APHPNSSRFADWGKTPTAFFESLDAPHPNRVLLGIGEKRQRRFSGVWMYRIQTLVALRIGEKRQRRFSGVWMHRIQTQFT